MYRVIRSSGEEADQLTLPYDVDVLQDCAKNGTLIPGHYYNNQTGETYNFMYVKSVVAKSGSVYMCPVSVGKDPDVLLFDSAGKIKVSLSQIAQGTDRTELKMENIDPKFTLDYVVNKTKQWLNKSLPKIVGNVAPVLSARYRAQNRYGSYIGIQEHYEYVMLVDRTSYDVKTGKAGIPNFEVRLDGHLFDVQATGLLYEYTAWKRSDSLYPFYIGYDHLALPLKSVANTTYPGSFADFPSKNIVLSTIDNLNLSKDEINYVMSELLRLAERSSYIPCANNSDIEAWFVTYTYEGNSTPILAIFNKGHLIKLKYNNTIAAWKDNKGYAVQYRRNLFYLNDAKDISDDVDVDEYLWNKYYWYSSCVNLNKVRSTMLDEN